jgi:hypothetical protein
VSDLVQGDEVGDLTADRWDPDLQRCLAAPSAADCPSPPPVQALDAVKIAEFINMGVEAEDALNRSRTCGERLPSASETGAEPAEPAIGPDWRRRRGRRPWT